MYFKFKCPHCKKSLRVREESSGKKLGCPYCQGSIRVPQIAAGSSLTLPTSEGAPDLDLNVPSINVSAKSRAAAKSSVPVRSSSGRWTDSCNVSLVVSGAIGLVASAILLGALYPLRQYNFAQLFWDRGWVPFALTLVFCWSFAILGLKWRKVSRQKASMLLDVLPTELADEITVDTIDRFGQHIMKLPGEPGESFLLNRVMRGLEHFRVRKSAAETVTMMASQAEIDANNVSSSYSLLKVFIWAMPIFGFIGTVIGISAAVLSLAGSLENASDISAVKESLNNVFAGLSTAFDTTLLALVMSMVVKIPASALQKSEEDIVSQVDEYCNENLLRRLNDGREGGAERGAGGGGIDRKVFRQAVEEAMGTHHAELERWLKKLDAIGGKLTTQIAEGWEEVSRRMHAQQQEHVNTMLLSQREASAQFDAQLQQMAVAAGEIGQSLQALAEQSAAMQASVNETVGGSADKLQTHFAGMERGLAQLTGVLERLGQQQVIVQQVERKRGRWFTRSRNGR